MGTDERDVSAAYYENLRKIYLTAHPFTKGIDDGGVSAPSHEHFRNDCFAVSRGSRKPRGRRKKQNVGKKAPVETSLSLEFRQGQMFPVAVTGTVRPHLSAVISESLEVDNVLQILANYPGCFSVEELAMLLGSKVGQNDVCQRLKNDSRFLWLCRQHEESDLYISERTLFLFWVYLTIGLAQAKQARLSPSELAAAMNSARVARTWDVPPEVAIDFGRSFGFVSRIRTSERYVFPLARILSHMSPSSMNLASELLKSFADAEVRDNVLNQSLQELVQRGFANFDIRVTEVVMAREGLQHGKRMTLAEIGTPLGLTRERVRQIEAKFWRRLSRRSPIITPFLSAFLFDIVRREGSLIVDLESPDSCIRKFVAKCVGVPRLEMPELRLAVLGILPEHSDIMGLPGLRVEPAEEVVFMSCLQREREICLTDADFAFLARRLLQYKQMIPTAFKVTKAQKVIDALRRIGRPAHFSEITEMYNSLFTNDPCSERQVHAVLNRQQGRVVWIGTKGTYGLTEWGCEKPSTTIFNAVAEIVRKKYSETGKPVQFTIIMAEIGKYRKTVHPASLQFAAHFNPRLQRVTQNAFIPKEVATCGECEITDDDLDRILKDFEETIVDPRNCGHGNDT